MQRCLLNFLIDESELSMLGFASQEYERLEDSDSIDLMFLHGTVPHHIYLLFTESVVCVQELKEEIALLDNLWVKRFTKHHIKD